MTTSSTERRSASRTLSHASSACRSRTRTSPGAPGANLAEGLPEPRHLRRLARHHLDEALRPDARPLLLEHASRHPEFVEEARASARKPIGPESDRDAERERLGRLRGVSVAAKVALRRPDELRASFFHVAELLGSECGPVDDHGRLREETKVDELPELPPRSLVGPLGEVDVERLRNRPRRGAGRGRGKPRISKGFETQRDRVTVLLIPRSKVRVFPAHSVRAPLRRAFVLRAGARVRTVATRLATFALCCPRAGDTPLIRARRQWRCASASTRSPVDEPATDADERKW